MRLAWTGCRAGTAVMHFRVSDVDHGCPGENALTGAHGFASTPQTYASLSAFRTPS